MGTKKENKQADEGEGQAFWAIAELMGHRRLAGYVREVQLAGAGFLRLDVHETCSKDSPTRLETDGTPICPDHSCPSPHDVVVATQFIAPASLYALTPVSEEVARAVAKTARPEPVHPWEMPALEDKRRRPGESVSELRSRLREDGDDPEGYDPAERGEDEPL